MRPDGCQRILCVRLCKNDASKVYTFAIVCNMVMLRGNVCLGILMIRL
jgi:hypothetical protein